MTSNTTPTFVCAYCRSFLKRSTQLCPRRKRVRSRKLGSFVASAVPDDREAFDALNISFPVFNTQESATWYLSITESGCTSANSDFLSDAQDDSSTAFEESPPVIFSLALNLRGRNALPSLASLTRYMRDLRPKLDYLGPHARERVLSALEVANVAHDGQKRKSGEPYIVHPIEVAGILADMRMDRDSIIAGLLHDTVEDTPFTLEEIESLFGFDVRRIVEGETKISKLASKVHGQNSRAFVKRSENVSYDMQGWARAKLDEEQEKQADNLRGMFLAMTEDVRVIIVKLADRLHNMRTLEHMKPEKQKKISKETLEFFAPLAHRLGMRRVKSELEELSFRYLYPTQFRELSAQVESIKRRTRFEHHLRVARDTLKNILEEDRILFNMIRSVNVVLATKGLYTIHKRCLAGESLSAMLDVVNLCVVTDVAPGVTSSAPCYHILGQIHNIWKPLPKQFKDYIAFPKPNGYQSLHTTVLLGQNHDFFAMEIHICTKEMHLVAEEGIAAELFHCPTPHPTVTALESGASVIHDGLDPEWRKRTQGWLISVRDYIDSFSSSRDLVDAVRRDLLGNRVFVFTPKGRIIDLPKDSTPVDLAYRIHTDVGHKMIGARVNGNMVSLDYKLQNADVVKIIGSNSSPGPSSEWMGYAKSRTARQRIRHFLRARDRENMLDRGRVLLETAACKRGYPVPSEAALSELIPRLSAVLSASSGIRNVKTVDDMYIAIAKGSLGDASVLETTVLTMLRDRRQAVDSFHTKLSIVGTELQDTSVSIDTDEGNDCQLELATCCHPVRGDEVMGIRTMDVHGNYSLVIHRLHCEHLLCELRQRPISRRVVGVRWTKAIMDNEFLLFTDASTRVEENETRPGTTARVVVVARDCDGLLSYVAGVLSGMGRSIRRAYTATDPVAEEATLAFEVLVQNAWQLRAIIKRIEACDEVRSVRRIGPNEGEEFFPPQMTRRFRKESNLFVITSDEVEIDELHDDSD